MAGTVEQIWIKRMKQGPMDEAAHVTAYANSGLKGNADQRGKRQVTILEKENWVAAMAELNGDLDPSRRRANLLVSGISLKDSRLKTLEIGNTRIQIYGETKPCEQMDAALPGLKDTLNKEWRGGVYGVILNDGEIHLGDPVTFIESQSD
ncbi:MOSC domain-containing protein [Salisediminibacterium selenitireducens]|uniref:MOSC domain containing protein n=1 Tax=Bacillus selenitireducens (strain ATCC 700615 / DSM 15326 / MLS10) TaxID=439292 RepID=D6XUE8_BACIE|nr:MOSC domain-containing protein [Salisediminibacterium selenitireducens]ADH99434.1 MOSC domain containing protein [[Bacillus] selenitireducens MLS10]